MVRYARLGHLSKAVARLTSLGVAPWSPEVEQELARLVSGRDEAPAEDLDWETEAPPPAFDWSANRPRFVLDPAVFRRRLKRAKRGSAPGPTGLRADHLHLFLSSPDHLERLLRVSTELANGGLPDLAHHLALSSLTPLSKGGNAVRPLALPDGLRRLVASTICEQLRDEFAEVLDPLSVAVGVPAAAEVVAKAVQAHSEHHPGWTYAKNDGRNAYCTMPRGPALEAVDTAFPALGRFCATWYARVSRYVLHRPDGTSRILRSTCGWDQGDPFAPAGYSLGSLAALQRARVRIRSLVESAEGLAAANAVLLVAFLDDVVIGVPSRVFAAALRILHEELRTVGHVPHWGKLEFWSPAGRRPPGLPPEATGWNPRGLTVLGVPLPAPPPTARPPSSPPAAAAPPTTPLLPLPMSRPGPRVAAGSRGSPSSGRTGGFLAVRPRLHPAPH